MVLGRAEEGEMFKSLRDWRKAVRSPPSYRVGKNVNRFQMQLILALGVICVFFLLVFYRSDSDDEHSSSAVQHFVSQSEQRSCPSVWKYNNTYPITRPKMIHDSVQFRIGLVSDMDHSSRSKLESNTWISYYLQGTLMWNPLARTVTPNFDKINFKTLKTKYSYDGRGMELSEIVTFNGRLFTFDDRAGIVFEIDDSLAYPWLILTDKDGRATKGFKAEWAAVKDEHLYIGSMGKEWTTPSGEFVNTNPMFVKKISPTGSIQSLDWTENYKALRAKLGIHFPGYMLHESATWSDVHKKWFFLPRRMSNNVYNEDLDETQGTNILLSCDETFNNIDVTTVGEVIPTHGFSSFKFIPGTNDEVIVALKTVEHKGKVSTYIMAFTINGKILLGETKIDDTKYEGFEFI